MSESEQPLPPQTPAAVSMERDSEPPAPIPNWVFGSVIFIVALLIRAVYLLEIRSIPFFRHLIADAESYYLWARQIASGQWLGHEVFYQAPLYPYFLAVAMKFVGDNLLSLRFVQALVGAGACVLLFCAGTRYFSRGVGILAGLLLALYPPAIFFDGLIQKTVLDGIGVAALLYLIARLQNENNPSKHLRVFGLLGLCLGGLILTRENALLFIPVLLVWILIRFRAGLPGRRLWSAAGAFAAGVGCVLLLVGIRNQIVGGEPILTTYQGGPNFYIGNNAHANGTYQPLVAGRGNTPFERMDATVLAQMAEKRKLTPREVSSFWFRKGFDFVTSEPAKWLRLLGLKTMLCVESYEIPDSEHQYYYERFSIVLRSLGAGLHFGLILPLGVMGFALHWRRRRDLWVLAALIASVIVGVAAFYVFARYRYPMVPILILLAAAGIVELFRRLRTKELQGIPVALLAACIAAIPANWPTPFSPANDMATSYSNAGITLARGNNATAAESSLREAIRIDPNFSAAHFGLGRVVMMQGRNTDAIAELETALRIGPEAAYVISGLGGAYLAAGETDRAIEYLERASKQDPFDAETWINLSAAYGRMDRWTDALKALETGHERMPNDPACTVKLAWLLATSPDAAIRDGDKAVTLTDDLLRLRRAPDYETLDVRAAALAEVGKFDESVSAERRALDIASAQRALDAVPAMESRLALFKSRQAYHQAGN